MNQGTAAGPSSVQEMLGTIGVLPVLVVERAGEDAVSLARSLAAGGLPAAEVTFRTAAAPDVLRDMAAEGQVLLGAGTVTKPQDVELAVKNGARFIVSPGWSEAVFHACDELGVPFIPGVATASDIQRAVEFGIDVVKFFPAQAMGGIATVSALAAPFAAVRFVPTGGITPENARDYLAHSAVLAVGGSWMAPSALIRDGNWPEITRLAKEATETVAAARPAMLSAAGGGNLGYAA
jgi:2-dehydro-3-deoxyphosphogluconate aldolase / (4S)-4-hydroxy-2-oxoglutarate aldolase